MGLKRAGWDGGLLKVALNPKTYKTLLLFLTLFILGTGKHVHILANSEDPDEMPQKAAFHQGLHCLLR